MRLIICILFLSSMVAAQPRYDISSRLQRYLIGGLPINSGWIVTDINGEQNYISNDSARTLLGIDTISGSTGITASDTAAMLAHLLKRSNNLSELTNTTTARTNLGLGSLAIQSGTFSGTSSGTNTGDQTNISGNAATANALASGRTLSITGDISYTSPAFDGSSNVSGSATVTKINGTFLSGLATGILKNTTSTGVPSIAVAGDFPTLNQNTTGTANVAGGTLGAICYQSAANTSTILAATATANKILLSGASAAPTWSTPTFPNASATTNKIIKSDGTNWIASTETYAAPSTSGNIATSDGTNWTSAVNQGGWTSLRVSGSDFTTTSTSLVNITGLVTGTLSTATLYEFECVLYGNSTSTAGIKIGIQQSGTGTGQIGVFSGTATASATGAAAMGSNALGTASGSALIVINGDGVIQFKGFIKTGSTGTPTISMQVLKVTSGTAKIYIGSVLRYRVAT